MSTQEHTLEVGVQNPVPPVLVARLGNRESNVVSVRANVIYDDAGALAPEALGNGPADTAPGRGHADDNSAETSLLLHGLFIECDRRSKTPQACAGQVRALLETAPAAAGPSTAAEAMPTGIAVSDASPALPDAIGRLLALVDTPRDAAALADGVEREVLWRLITAPQGERCDKSAWPLVRDCPIQNLSYSGRSSQEWVW